VSAGTRILVVNHAAVLGGAEMILLDVVRHLGDRCSVLLLSDGPLRERLAAQGTAVDLLQAGAGMMGVRRGAGKLRALASMPSVALLVARLVGRARKADLLYANSQKAAVVVLLAAVLARRPAVWHMHDILSAEHFAGLQRRVVVRLARLARARMIVISEVARQSVVAAGCDPARVTVVPNGIDPASFDTTRRDAPHTLRSELGLGTAPVVALFGRLAPWKGQHVLLAALRRLPGVHALIVGDALFGEDTYKARLAADAEAPDLAGRVHLLGHRADVPELMQAADLVVHCSVAPEPFGRVIVEAMLAGKPVLASAHGASRELLGADYEGLVPPGDPASLAHAIETVLSWPDARRRTVVATNAVRAREKFSLDRMMRDIDEVIACETVAAA
jgi:glycosyltransferase involved in cell wall biosynthesis